jgi:hypothetical protein
MDKEPMPAEQPDVFAECDAGNCAAAADTWIWDSAIGVYIPACKSCAMREAEWA